MTMENLDLSSVEDHYIFSNTPMYLVRRLKEDAAVASAAKQNSPQFLADQYKTQVRKPPENVREAVIPYVCLVALFLQKQAAKLKEMTALSPDPSYKFIAEVNQILVQTLVPTNVFSGNFPQETLSNNFTINPSKTATSFSSIVVK
ncbi:hypothetical protein BPNPMPFG_000304 [Mesorhizobium sp. AR07]|uniref:hypothetical protein n=1 Tax=Mesorhizobium sp. AR07 TaxID=2865838 RepID=UPI002160C0D8|nr:hypothetical protein [Mesorhizobium sp. AR07]UVK44839.1 hypothetical protein BPNPMPFG_000304 [Mesorhizobium sp. AR07]